MHWGIFYLWMTRRSDGLKYLILCLPARPFSGLVGETVSPPIKYPDFSRTVVILPLVFFLFYKVCFPTPWSLRKKWRDPLCPWGPPFNCMCPTFLEDAPKLSAYLMSISAWAGGFILSDIIGFILSCRRVEEVIRPLLSGFFLVGFSSLGPLCDRGSGIIGVTASQVREMSREVFYLPAGFVVP